jgi:peptide methionine sulfoxide reductase MsrB
MPNVHSTHFQQSYSKIMTAHFAGHLPAQEIGQEINNLVHTSTTEMPYCTYNRPTATTAMYTCELLSRILHSSNSSFRSQATRGVPIRISEQEVQSLAIP